MMRLIAGLGTPLGKAGVIGSLILALVGLRACDVNKQRSIGEERHAKKVETATNEAVSKAARAGSKSASGGGVRSKYYRD